MPENDSDITPDFDRPTYELVMDLVDEKLKNYATEDAARSIAAEVFDGRIKRSLSMIKWFSAGAGFILAVLLIDIFTVNKFARSTFRALVGVETYVTENGPTLVDNYISSTRFLSGSYAQSSEQEVSGCEPIVVVLPFQANSLKHEVKVFVALDLPPNLQNVKLRPFVNDTKMDEVHLNLNEATSSRVINHSFSLTETLLASNAAIGANTSMSVFALSVKPEPASQDGIRSLNGLPPDAASDGGCGQFTGRMRIRMIAEVVGDPRVEKQ